MRARIERACGIALVLGLLLGCASDLWYKKGAGTEQLAQDKSACRSEVAQAGAAKPVEAFEQCMRARDWYHMATASPRSATPRRTRSVAAVRAAPRPAPTSASEPPQSIAPVSAMLSPGEPASGSSSDSDVAAPTPEDVAIDTPAVGAAPEDAGVEAEETALEPEPIDPQARQYWVKLGARDDQLRTDQRGCRRELGLEADASEPSRWGQSEDFDTCMRGRGWGGGALRGKS